MRRLALLGGMVVALVLMAAPAQAQRGGGGGGVLGDLSFGVDDSRRTRLEILADLFTLTGDQRRAVRDILDEAHASAGPVRDQLTSTRGALATAIIEGQDAAALEAATAAYAEPVAAMTGIEMQALARIMLALQPEQQGNASAVSAAFFLMRGMFLDGRRWDVIPESRGY